MNTFVSFCPLTKTGERDAASPLCLASSSFHLCCDGVPELIWGQLTDADNTAHCDAIHCKHCAKKCRLHFPGPAAPISCNPGSPREHWDPPDTLYIAEDKVTERKKIKAVDTDRKHGHRHCTPSTQGFTVSVHPIVNAAAAVPSCLHPSHAGLFTVTSFCSSAWQNVPGD